jgi:hypothetical protein
MDLQHSSYCAVTASVPCEIGGMKISRSPGLPNSAPSPLPELFPAERASGEKGCFRYAPVPLLPRILNNLRSNYWLTLPRQDRAKRILHPDRSAVCFPSNALRGHDPKARNRPRLLRMRVR